MMKKLLLTSLVFLAFGFTLQAQDQCTGWQKAGSMGKQAQISINICERSSGGSGYVKLKNSADKAVRVSYEISFNNGESQSGTTPIKANAETSGSSCFNCAKKNGGGVSSWSVYDIKFDGEVSSSESSSNNTAEQTGSQSVSDYSERDENESMVDEDKTNDDEASPSVKGVYLFYFLHAEREERCFITDVLYQPGVARKQDDAWAWSDNAKERLTPLADYYMDAVEENLYGFLGDLKDEVYTRLKLDWAGVNEIDIDNRAINLSNQERKERIEKGVQAYRKFCSDKGYEMVHVDVR